MASMTRTDGPEPATGHAPLEPRAALGGQGWLVKPRCRGAELRSSAKVPAEGCVGRAAPGGRCRRQLSRADRPWETTGLRAEGQVCSWNRVNVGEMEEPGMKGMRSKAAILGFAMMVEGNRQWSPSPRQNLCHGPVSSACTGRPPRRLRSPGTDWPPRRALRPEWHPSRCCPGNAFQLELEEGSVSVSQGRSLWPK